MPNPYRPYESSNYTEGVKFKDILALFILIGFIVGVLWFFFTPHANNATEAPISSGSATLGQQLIFPRGWHLVSASAYAFQATGPYIVYICQKDTNSAMYRICTPKTLEEASYGITPESAPMGADTEK